MCVIAALDPSSIGHWLLVILQVIAGLGFVIFVHELGHFAVAKACGVKCPKFYLGFDVPLGQMINGLMGREGDRVFGVPIPRTIGPPIQIGETEYGIGILPLGGYVRMLGQDDDPANIAQQLKESEVAGNTADAKEIVGPDGKTYWVDKRSYLAKSVPQRMAIISAGVVMNVIFAFIFATIAYKIGVPYNPSVVSRTAPGSPAWQADVRPGDEVVQIADVVEPSFTDLSAGVSLGDVEGGIPFKLRRGEETIDVRLFPKQGPGLPRVGIAPPASLRLPNDLTGIEDLPGGKAEPPFKGGDEIIAVDGQPVATFAELSSILIRNPDKPLTLTVRRGGKPVEGKPDAPVEGGETVDLTLAPRPLKHLGLVMEMGKVTAVQANSAAAGKIEPGDFIDRIVDASSSSSGGERAELTLDPMTLPEDLRRMADEGREVEVSLRPASSSGDGRQLSRTIVIPLREVDWLEGPLGPTENDPVVATALGIAYNVLSVVDRVQPDSPAAKAGLEAEDVITQAEFVYPEGYDGLELETLEFSRDESAQKANWPALMASLQMLPEGAQVELSYKRGDEMRTATLTPTTAEGYFLAERGIPLSWIERIRVADTWGEAVQRGYDETTSALGMVYRFLSKLGTQVSVTTLGGPITIAKAAGFSAFEGVGKLLVFLTMLSANLAVINFLPIPLLDGGHMVFLLWEGIRGKPASEKFVGAMHAAGFLFIITLMLFVLSLDLGIIPRNL